jgi:hypothetical protein
MSEYWPISASIFLQIGGPGTVADQFPSREGLDETTLSAIRHPTFCGVGAEDFAAYPSPHNAVAQADALPTVQAVEIPGAPHDFAGHVERLRDWDSTGRAPDERSPTRGSRGVRAKGDHGRCRPLSQWLPTRRLLDGRSTPRIPPDTEVEVLLTAGWTLS